MDQLITCPLCAGRGTVPMSTPEPCARCRGRGTTTTGFAPHTRPALGRMPWESHCPDCGGTGRQRFPAITVCAMCTGRGTLPQAAVTYAAPGGPAPRTRW
jgi:molecular chaperone DnaJ